uniref:Claudin 1b n=1 Tax=Lateolabrax maculatus TaxID=315492 RepID=A0A8X8RHN3_LATMC|nr:claudin 1b [Lateolabrax maculatus]
MASSGLQLLGFLLSLAGLAATVVATVMVEWKKQAQGKTHRIYEGLWMSCSGNERTTCELHESLLKLPTEVQAARAVMLLSIFLSTVALLISTVGMKCTRFMDDKPESKSITAMIGGILFMVAVRVDPVQELQPPVQLRLEESGGRGGREASIQSVERRIHKPVQVVLLRGGNVPLQDYKYYLLNIKPVTRIKTTPKLGCV